MVSRGWPRRVEKHPAVMDVDGKILPRFRPQHRQYVALVLLSLLIMAYLPMMQYSKASFLTGVFDPCITLGTYRFFALLA